MLLHGRGEFMEKYAETIGDLLRRGFSVFSMDWRGQGLSDRPLEDRRKGHVDEFQSYVDDLAQFAEDVVGPRAAGPVIALAHSMGGHITLRYLHDRPNRLAGAVLCAPMLGLPTWPLPPAAAAGLVSVTRMIGMERLPMVMPAAFSASIGHFTGNRRTTDPVRFEVEGACCRRNPDLAVCTPTWGWLDAAYQSMELVDRRDYAKAIEAPVLIVGSSDDHIVSTPVARDFARWLPKGEYLEVTGARHEVLSERDELRDIFWAGFDRFVDGLL